MSQQCTAVGACTPSPQFLVTVLPPQDYAVVHVPYELQVQQFGIANAAPKKK